MHHPIHPLTEQFLIFILGAAVVHGLYISILIFFHKGRILSNRILGISIFSISLHLVNYLFFLTGFISIYPHWLSVLAPVLYLVGPSIYFFIYTSLNPGFKWKIVHLIHLIPFLYQSWRSIRILRIDSETKLAYINQLMDPQSGDFSWLDFLWGTSSSWLILSYAIAGWWICKSSKHLTEDKINRKIVLWLMRFCIGFAVLILGDWLIKFLSFLMDWPSFSIEYILAAFSAVFIHIAGYFALGKLPGINPAKPQYQNSGLNKGQIESYKSKLIQLLTSEKPWLKADLKISDLADLLGIPSHQLSQVLSEGMQTNYSDLINSYRLEEVKIRLLAPEYKHYSILAIALDCGFNSKATFNRVFRKEIGMTPSQYAKGVHQAKG